MSTIQRTEAQRTEAPRTEAQRTEAQEWKYAEKALAWSGWGSPIGLGIFIVAVGAFLLLIHYAGIIR